MTDHDDLVTRRLEVEVSGEEGSAGAVERRKARFRAAIARLKTDAVERGRIEAIAASADAADLADAPPSAADATLQSGWRNLLPRNLRGEDAANELPPSGSTTRNTLWRQPVDGLPRGGAAVACLEGPLLTPAEVATMFRVDPKTVTRWANAGKLTSIRTLGGHRRYRETEVRALLAGIPQMEVRGEPEQDKH